MNETKETTKLNIEVSEKSDEEIIEELFKEITTRMTKIAATTKNINEDLACDIMIKFEYIKHDLEKIKREIKNKCYIVGGEN